MSLSRAEHNKTDKTLSNTHGNYAHTGLFWKKIECKLAPNTQTD